jgi:IclR family acetate operon transcriptional repressor
MTATAETTAAYPIRAVERVCDILDVLQQHADGASLADVAELTALPKSSAYRYLLALEARRYVERDESGSLYRLGLAFRPSHKRELDVLIECARPHLERLRDAIGETTNLGVLDGATIVHALVAESPNMMRLAARVGEHGAVHATALGKAITAGMPEERVRMLIRMGGMSPLTEHTIVSEDQFVAELERVRTDGYGVDDCENQLDGRCVAVALHDTPVAAGISVSAPAHRLAREDVADVGKKLRDAAARISKDFRARAT